MSLHIKFPLTPVTEEESGGADEDDKVSDYSVKKQLICARGKLNVVSLISSKFLQRVDVNAVGRKDLQ